MKKLLMFLCCFFAMNTIVAYGATEKTCSETTLYLEGNQKIDDDEFLYRNKSEYDKAVNGIKNSTARSTTAMVYECDKSSRDENCNGDAVVTLEAWHYWQGKPVDHKETYVCKTRDLTKMRLNDKWEPVGSFCRIQNTVVAVNEEYKQDGEVAILSLEQCSGLWITDNINGIFFKAVCEEGPVAKCIAVECIDGMEPDEKGICKPKENEHVSDKPDPTPPVKPTKPTTPVKPNPAPTPEPNPVPTPQAVVWNCPVLNFAPYVSCPDADKAIADLKVYCASNESRSQAGYDAMVNLVNVYIKDCEAKQKENDALNQRNKLNSLNSNILGAMDGWKKTLSVWKTSEGDFNTARLASDSVAGVVLGTAGGLITSKVVKKNQVKSGFEDIQCTIGGQKVADWHDEFTVGIQ